jgi:phosphoribosylanthranilate isomerase
MTQIKICGLTRPKDVRLCAELGAWAVGFVLTDSPRRLTALRARRLRGALAASSWRHDAEMTSGKRSGRLTPLAVGVFTVESAEEIAKLSIAAELDAIQLSAGRDGPLVAEVRTACARLSAQPASRPLVFAAVDTPDAADADYVLLDSRTPGRYGGTGRPLDWRALPTSVPASPGPGSSLPGPDPAVPGPGAAVPGPDALPAGAVPDPDARRVGAVSSAPPLILAGGLTPDNAAEAIAAVRPFAVDVSSGVEDAPGSKDPSLLLAFFAAVMQADTELAHRSAAGRTTPSAPDEPTPSDPDRSTASVPDDDPRSPHR